MTDITLLDGRVVTGAVLAARGLLPAERQPAPLDLALEPGTICCIVGPAGSGKTAWLRTLAALDPPAEGDLELVGLDTNRLGASAWRALRLRAAYVGDNPALLSILRADDNVTVAARYHRIADAASIQERAEALLERLGWRGPLDVLPAYLDGHQRVLLALARCLILDPLILFLHEPFRMIDVAAWRSFGAVLAGLARRRGQTLVMVTQNLAFVRRWADHILFTGEAGISEHLGWQSFAREADEPEIRQYLRGTGQGGLP